MALPSFIEVQFPTNISYGAVGGGGWSTRIVVTDAGYEYRQQLWNATRGKWTVGHNLRTPAEYGQLVAFHRNMLGRTIGFRFQDWTDYQAPDAAGNSGIISKNASGIWQLTKSYSVTDEVSGFTYSQYRLISKPQPGTVQLFLNSVAHTLGAGGSLDYTSGQITFGSGDPNPGPSEVYTWTGQFDVPVRFDTDAPQFSYDIPTGVGWRGIPIIELRVKGQ